MLVILFGRVMLLEDHKNGFVLYVVPKIIKSVATLRINLKKERDCLSRDTKMLVPVLVGEYNITRFKLAKICKDDIILKKNINQNLFNHWTFDSIPNNTNIFYEIIKDIQMRLQFVMKPMEMNGPFGFERHLQRNLTIYKGFCEYRRFQIIEEQETNQFEDE